MKEQHRGRGRPAGALSFVRVKLSDLNKFITPDAPVVVSYKWLQAIGMVGNVTVLKPEEATIQATEIPAEQEDKIQLNMLDFDLMSK